MEKELENIRKALSNLVARPLKAVINDTPLKDTQNLKQKYDHLGQDANSQANEVTRRKAKEGSGNPKHVVMQSRFKVQGFIRSKGYLNFQKKKFYKGVP